MQARLLSCTGRICSLDIDYTLNQHCFFNVEDLIVHDWFILERNLQGQLSILTLQFFLELSCAYLSLNKQHS